MIFKSANRLGFIFKTEEGETRIKLNEHLKVTTYLREFSGELISINFETGHKRIVIVADNTRQLLQISFVDIVKLEAL